MVSPTVIARVMVRTANGKGCSDSAAMKVAAFLAVRRLVTVSKSDDNPPAPSEAGRGERQSRWAIEIAMARRRAPTPMPTPMAMFLAVEWPRFSSTFATSA